MACKFPDELRCGFRAASELRGLSLQQRDLGSDPSDIPNTYTRAQHRAVEHWCTPLTDAASAAATIEARHGARRRPRFGRSATTRNDTKALPTTSSIGGWPMAAEDLRLSAGAHQTRSSPSVSNGATLEPLSEMHLTPILLLRPAVALAILSLATHPPWRSAIGCATLRSRAASAAASLYSKPPIPESICMSGFFAEPLMHASRRWRGGGRDDYPSVLASSRTDFFRLGHRRHKWPCGAGLPQRLSYIPVCNGAKQYWPDKRADEP